MAYATNAHISAEFKDILFSASTAVTDTDVDRFIDEADAYIDGMIASRYETPVSGPISVLILRTICILIVKARILSILSVKTPQDKNKQDPDGPSLLEQAKKMLSDIKKGQLVLSDATGSSTDGGLTSFLKDEDIEYQFQLEKDAW